MKRILAALFAAFAVSAHAGLETGTYINDLVATNPPGSDPRAQGADHLRLIKSTIQATFPFMAGTMSRSQSKGSNYVVATTDNQSLIKATAVINVTFPASSTLTNGFRINVYASSGIVTLIPNGVETINGAATLAIPSGYVVTVWSDGSNLFSTLPSGGAIAGTSNQITATLSGATTTLSLPAAVTMPGSLTVTTTLTGVTAAFTKAAAGDVITFTNGGASNKTGYLYSDNQYVGLATGASLSADQIVIDVTNHTIGLWTGASHSETLRLNNSGDVGKFTSSVGSSRTAHVYADATYVGFGATATLGGDNLYFDNTSHIFGVQVNNVLRLTLTSTGLSVTGTLGVSGAATFSAPSAAIILNSGTAPYIQFMTGATVNGFLGPGGALVTGGGANDMALGTNAGNPVWLYTNNGVPQVRVNHTASATRYITLTGSNGGTSAIGTSAGSLDLTTGTRVTAATTPTTGAGLELAWDGTTGYIQAYDRSGTGYKAVAIYGDKLTIVAKAGAEQAQFTSAGYFKASSSGTYNSSTGAFHELRADQNGSALPVLRLEAFGATATNQNGIQLYLAGDPNNTTNFGFQLVGNATTRATIWSDGSIDSKTQTLRNNTVKVATTAYVDTQSITEGTPLVTTSGTTRSFTGLPTGIRRIVISLKDVSTSGTSPVILQLSTGATFATSGYTGSNYSSAGTGTNSAAGSVLFQIGNATYLFGGTVILTRENSSTNTWVVSSGMYNVSSVGAFIDYYTGSGWLALSGEIDGVRLNTVGGTDTFDNGEMNISYQR